MKKHFHGQNKQSSYFEGWYFKQENNTETLAVIPAFHVDENGEKSVSMQVITGQSSWYLYFPISMFRASSDRLGVKIGENIFTEKGIRLSIHEEGINLEGSVRFGNFTPMKKEIMGPFFYFPGMQCTHEVESLYHELKGDLYLNGNKISLDGGRGYLEKDRGRSFPKEYMWTQCGFEDQGGGCIMAAVADVPFLFGSFSGCICIILYRGKQYRFATYLGARVVLNQKSIVVIRQGIWTLRMTALQENPKILLAPSDGKLGRAIQESASCPVRYELFRGKKSVLRILGERAGWERG